MSHAIMDNDGKRFWAHVAVRGQDECWLWTGDRTYHGYGRLRDATGRRVLAHRFADSLANGALPQGQEIMHTCDVRACVNTRHLRRGTHKQNMEDMATKLRGSRGVSHSHAKLTPEAVKAICDLRSAGVRTIAIAEQFGISQRHVYDVVSHKWWRQVWPVETQRALL